MKVFTSYHDLPQFTPNGYTIDTIPNKIWNYIQEIYYLVKLQQPTNDGMFNDVGEINANKYKLENIPYLRGFLLDQLKPLHEEWCGEELIPCHMYGVRSYNKGATLLIHRDRIETHHISSIINLEWDEDWAIEIEGHDKQVKGITTNSKEIILYESAKCRHARTIPFKGTYYNNLYLHYTLKNWEYRGNKEEI